MGNGALPQWRNATMAQCHNGALPPWRNANMAQLNQFNQIRSNQTNQINRIKLVKSSQSDQIKSNKINQMKQIRFPPDNVFIFLTNAILLFLRVTILFILLIATEVPYVSQLFFARYRFRSL